MKSSVFILELVYSDNFFLKHFAQTCVVCLSFLSCLVCINWLMGIGLPFEIKVWEITYALCNYPSIWILIFDNWRWIFFIFQLTFIKKTRAFNQHFPMFVVVLS